MKSGAYCVTIGEVVEEGQMEAGIIFFLMDILLHVVFQAKPVACGKKMKNKKYI